MATYIDPLRQLYIDLNGELVSKDEKQIKQLIVDRQLDKEEIKELCGAADIFLKLEERGYINRNNLTLITQLLTSLKRPDLIKKFVIPCETVLAIDKETVTSQLRKQIGLVSEEELRDENKQKTGEGVCHNRKQRNEIYLVVLFFGMAVFTSYAIAVYFQPEEKIYYTYSGPSTQSPSATKTRSILILGQAWSTTNGGLLSSAHRNIAMLAKLTVVFDVYVTTGNASQEDMEDAHRNGVKLIVADRKGKELDTTWSGSMGDTRFSTLCEIKNVRVVIGHIPITGKQAIQLKEDCFPNANLFLFIHVTPMDELMHEESWTELELEEREKKFCKQANQSDIVFSVGPKVFNHCEKTFELLPVKQLHYLPLPSVKLFYLKRPELHHHLTVLSLGPETGVRNVEVFGSLAAALSDIAEVRHKINHSSTTWLIRGLSDTDDYWWSRVMRNVTSPHLRVERELCKSQRELQEDLQQSHLFVLPFHSEPFNSVGLEAIAAGVPFLVSNNTGLAVFIREQLPDLADDCIVDFSDARDELDEAAAWRRVLHKVLLNNYTSTHTTAYMLRDRLRKLVGKDNFEQKFSRLLLG